MYYEVPLQTDSVQTQRTLTGFYRGDNAGKTLRVTFIRPDGTTYAIPGTFTAILFGVKPDGTHIMHTCSIEDGQALYVPTAQTTAAIGTVQCQVVVYGADGLSLFAPKFSMVVSEPVEPPANLVSANELTALNTLLTQVSAVLAQANTHYQSMDSMTTQAQTLIASMNASVQNIHTHTNKTVLDKFSAQSDTLSYDGKQIALTASDSFVSLSIRSYPSLVFNTMDKMLSVPFFNADYTGFKVALENEDQTELIRYSDTQDTETGLPVPFLSVQHGGTEYICWLKNYNGLYGLHSAGWYTLADGVETACNAPVLQNFTPTKLTYCNTSYTASDTIPDNALKALHSLSRIVNVDTASMGTAITVGEDEIVRFKGDIECNRTYAFGVGDDVDFTLPTVAWSDKERQFVLYLYAASDISLSFPTGTKFYGGEVPTIEEAGTYKLIGTVEPFGNAWTVGMLTMEASA